MPTTAQLRLRIAAIIAAPVICLAPAGVANATGGERGHQPVTTAYVASEKTKTVGG